MWETIAIEHLKDESLAIRMGALFELKKQGLEVPADQENIVRILAPFIRNGIENKELLLQPVEDKDRMQPLEDVLIACEITSLFWQQSKVRANLRYLNAPNLLFRNLDLQGTDLRSANLQGADLSDADLQGTDLRSANLQGADLSDADLQETDLRSANLQGADLSDADLQGTDLRSANLQGADLSDADLQDADLRAAYLKGTDLISAKNLIAEQLLRAFMDNKTNLDLELRNDPRIQARIEEVNEIIAEREADGTEETDQ